MKANLAMVLIIVGTTGFIAVGPLLSPSIAQAMEDIDDSNGEYGSVPVSALPVVGVMILGVSLVAGVGLLPIWVRERRRDDDE